MSEPIAASPGPGGAASPARWCAGVGAVAHVFVADLGDALRVAGDDGHHLQRVRRLQEGERVSAADGAGTWRAYRITRVGRGELHLEADGDPQREPDGPGLTVAFAPTKGGQPERVVAALTELGVAAVTPLLTERTVVRWAPEKVPGVLARWERVAREAAALARRAHLPRIGSPVTVAQVLADPALAAGLVVADRGGERRMPPAAEGARTVLVGPEGGFSGAERDVLRGVPVLSVAPHVLSADTAPVAVAAVLTHGASIAP